MTPIVRSPQFKVRRFSASHVDAFALRLVQTREVEVDQRATHTVIFLNGVTSIRCVVLLGVAIDEELLGDALRLGDYVCNVEVYVTYL